MKKLLVVLLGCLLVLTGCGGTKDNSSSGSGSGSGSGSATGATIVDELLVSGKLIVGTSPDYPPFESYDTSGQIIGFDMDVIQGVVGIINKNNDLNLVVEFKPMDFDLIVTSVQQNQADIGMSAFTYNPERDVTFTSTYLESKQVAVVRADSGIETLADLEGKTIAAGLGTTGEEAAKGIEGATVVSPGDYNYMFAALEAGQVDVVVCDEAVGESFVAEKGFIKIEEPLVDETMHIITNKAKTVLSAEISKAVEEFVQTEEYQELLKKWGFAE